MTEDYLECISLIERLHRHFLELVKAELDRLGVEDINNVQSLILYNIGSDELTVGELTNRGYYLGSNVSYNVKKMVENGYLLQERSAHDRRSVRVRVSDKGLDLVGRIDAMYQRHVEGLTPESISPDELKQIASNLRRLDSYWTSLQQFGLRGAP